MNSPFLDALQCRNQGRPPVWLMRQAGRYMPEYRALRERHSLWQLFHQPELAAEITLQPVNLLGVDAAILFSDILVIAEVFGLQVVFPEGAPPRIVPQVVSAEALIPREVAQTLKYVQETIKILKPHLKIPLIGFCGAPFTLATYMTPDPHGWIARDREGFHRFLDKVSDALIEYLLMQVRAGVEAIQIFDSWANLLPPTDCIEFSHRYLKKICTAMRVTNIPVILFSRNASQHPALLADLGPSAISFDWNREIHLLRKEVPGHIAVQGNLDPEFLQNASKEQVVERTTALVESMRGEGGFILNLGHGVLPKTPVENVRAFIRCAQDLY